MFADSAATILNSGGNQEFHISGLRGSSHAWLTSHLGATQTCICIVPDEHLVPLLEEDLRLFAEVDVLVYPGYEIPPYTPLSPDQRTTATRLSTLYTLQENRSARIVVTSIEALMRRVLPRTILANHAELIQTGEEVDQKDLISALINSGYEQVALVRSVGDFEGNTSRGRISFRSSEVARCLKMSSDIKM